MKPIDDSNREEVKKQYAKIMDDLFDIVLGCSEVKSYFDGIKKKTKKKDRSPFRNVEVPDILPEDM